MQEQEAGEIFGFLLISMAAHFPFSGLTILFYARSQFFRIIEFKKSNTGHGEP